MDEASCMQVCSTIQFCRAITIELETETCRIAKSCLIQSHDPRYKTYVRPIHADTDKIHAYAKSEPTTRKFEPEDCSYCPPQNPCEQPRFCRLGQCFNGLKLPDGHNCIVDGHRRGGCVKGICIPSASQSNFDVDEAPENILNKISIQRDVECIGEFAIPHIGSTFEQCASDCMEATYSTRLCAMFTVERSGLRRCFLYKPGTKCRSSEGFTTGVVSVNALAE